MTMNDAHQHGDARTQFARLAKPLVGEARRHGAPAAHDAEDVHKLRVALRRLRTLLWAWRPLLDRDSVERERAFLRRVAVAAGEVRDWDIAVQQLDAEGIGLQGERLEALRREARGRLVATLSAADLKRSLPDLLHQVQGELNTTRGRKPARPYARKRVRAAREALRKRIRRARKAGKSEYAAWHDVRKGAKKLRYLLEFFAPMAAHGYKKRLKALKKIQKRFGNLNDSVATGRLLNDHRDVFPDDATAQTALKQLRKESRRRRRAASKALG